MKGTNVLRLNQQTMCEALQIWAKDQFAGPNVPTVTLVKVNSDTRTYGSTGDDFEVTVEMVEKA